ncbi:related to actin cytoskeleton (VIP1) [Lecanosticta acicola]|uniref:Related to actin cytoskeleton (VIP1) n=1 Tax=Lecanosticta acicola TaxID=111012 RepID=A0AAI9EDC7_9PEZI|nr:related to actin cytoskeleton (VIP1) [Lecanosticta acicola]
MSATVHVKGISAQTSEKEVRDFFSFCGKIQSLSVKPETSDSASSQSASVTFEKETAAKTALLLDNTQLGPSQVNVTAASSLDDLSGGKPASNDNDDLAQEDKPRARVAAEMLAHGYVLSDQAIQRALALDQQHGISTRFNKALQDFDTKYKVTERAQQADKSYGVSARADAGWRGLNSYFEKALGTPTGQKIRAFYEQGQKQVLDVHNEAKHLATLKKGSPVGPPEDAGQGRTKCNCGAATGICPCEPGKCACNSCGKNPEAKTTSVTPEQAEMEKVQVDGKEKTKCNCAADESKCPCEPGKCACASCPKSS